MTNNKPTFSVVIPVYNGALFIARAIESCLQQTQLPQEIIVIDDASNDETASIVQKIDSGLIVYKQNSENRGPSFCRNAGINTAKSDWIFFLDADDTFHKQKIEIIAYCIEQNNSIKSIGHSFNLQSDPEFEAGNQWQSKAIPGKINTGRVLTSNPMVTPSIAVAASNNILFNEQMLYAEDHDFILRTAETFGTWYLDMPLCSLARRPLTSGGISSNRWKMRKGEMKMYVNYCRRNKLSLVIPFFILFSLLKHVNSTVRNS